MLRVGIIGLGGIARSHAAAIAELDNVEITAVADLFPEVREQFMNTWGVGRGYATHTELIEGWGGRRGSDHASATSCTTA